MVHDGQQKVVSAFHASRFISQAAKFWDIFYKRNSTRFFKDRRWTDREFPELLESSSTHRRTLLEIGCGVGNFIFPLMEKNLNMFIYACDFSPRAIAHVMENPLYDGSKCKAFVCDVSKDQLSINDIDLVSMCFVLSAIVPEKHMFVVRNINRAMKQGALVLFRDYAVNDEAQKRFEQSKDPKCISNNLYVRQDGTLSYFFDKQELQKVFEENGFACIECDYVFRITNNNKEDLSLQRIFLQAKFIKL